MPETAASPAVAFDEEPPPTPPVAVDVHHAGGLDRSSARAAWPAVLSEIKKTKPGRAQLFGAADIEVDSDGETLVVEFPGDQAFSVQLAEEPEMRELLKRALASALGFAPPVRFQLGKGAVRPAEAVRAAAASESPVGVQTPERAAQPKQAPASDTSYDDEPVPEYYETGAGMSEPIEATVPVPLAPPTGTDPTAPESDLTRLLTGMGAQIVAQHAAPPDALTPATDDDDDAAAELASADAAPYGDPGLFDSDAREDEAQ
ncbi:MAG: hypothetical protein P4L93_07665 [Coriobacteriia bacterium]|nr:hypothetical protein [Coriobacteriia bacterium]